MVQMENQFQFLYNIIREEFEKPMQPINRLFVPASPKLWETSGKTESQAVEDSDDTETVLKSEDKNVTTIGGVSNVQEAKSEIN